MTDARTWGFKKSPMREKLYASDVSLLAKAKPALLKSFSLKSRKLLFVVAAPAAVGSVGEEDTRSPVNENGITAVVCLIIQWCDHMACRLTSYTG